MKLAIALAAAALAAGAAEGRAALPDYRVAEAIEEVRLGLVLALSGFFDQGTPTSERLDSALDDAARLLAPRPGLTADGRQARACALGAVRGLRGAQGALARGDRARAARLLPTFRRRLEACDVRSSVPPAPAGTLVVSAARGKRPVALFLAEVDGSAVRRLTTPGPGLNDGSARWSPDGTRIAFVRENDDVQRLMLVNADGSGLRGLGPGRSPSWSPDGTRLAVERDDEVTVLDVDGSRPPVRLPFGDSPDWSPDGSRIVYNVAARLYTVSPDGGPETRVPGTGDSAALALSGEPLRWSPDGRSILAGRIGTGFVVIGVDGRPRLRLGEGSVGLAGWAPDGRVVAGEQSIVTFGYRYALLAVDGSGRSRQLGPLVGAARRAGLSLQGLPEWRPAPPLTS